MGNGGFVFRKKKPVFVIREPLKKASDVFASKEAKDRVISAIKLYGPGTPMRWDKVLVMINRKTEPSEEDPSPLNIDINFEELKSIMIQLYQDVKFISSDGLALLRQHLPVMYDKHNLERTMIISSKERQRRHLKDESYAYGEVDSDIFATMYLKAVAVFGNKDDGIFYDLGCGVGTLVFTAAFLGNFKKVVGIEELGTLLERGDRRMGRWDQLSPSFPVKTKDTKIEWIEDNFVISKFWIEANFIVLHWTAFSDTLRKQVTEILVGCAEGTHIVTFTHPIQHEKFEILIKDTCDTSWGKAEFFFHEKLSPAQKLDMT